MRTCNHCGKVEGEVEFYASMRTKCKECHREMMRAHYGTTGYRVKNAAYRRRRYNEDPEYRKRQLARVAVKEAIKHGEMCPPQHCSSCHERKTIQAHHPDYDKPLSVIWLCLNCHVKVHSSDEDILAEINQESHTI